MRKNTLYIHGLDSSLNNDKMIEIGEFGGVTGLHLNYRTLEDPFKVLDNEIVEKKITHIIGSSLGGYLGFYLAHKHQLPCLLFNPALSNRTVTVPVEEHKLVCPQRIIVLGMKDDILNPVETINFLKEDRFLAKEEELIINQNLEHQIPMPVFKKAVSYFLS